MPIRSSAASSTKGSPTAPTIGTATAGNGSASVTFSAPSFSKLPVTSYTVTASPGGATGTGASSPITVSGLTNGTAYTFTVTATNGNGTSAASSASSSVTPASSASTFAVSFTAATSGVQPAGQGLDSSGNAYSVGRAITPSSLSGSNYRVYLSKSSPNGAISYTKEMYVSGQETNESQLGPKPVSCAVDSSGNTHITSAFNSSAGVGVSKFNSSGALQWSKSYTITGGVFTGNPLITDISVDSSGNVYTTTSTGYGQESVTKFNSSGTFQWVRGYDGSPQGEGEGENPPYPPLSEVSCDSSGNIFVSGITRGLYGQYEAMYITKLNSSGVVQWQYSWRSSSDTMGAMYSSATDSSGNLYVFTLDSVSNGVVSKIDTNGTLQWQKKFADGPSKGGISVSANGTVHVVYKVYSDPSLIWRSFNSSGAEQSAYIYSISGGSNFIDGLVNVSANDTYTLMSGVYGGAAGLALKLAANASQTTFTFNSTTFTRSSLSAAQTGNATVRTTENIPWSDYSAYYSATGPYTLTVMDSSLSATKFTF